MSDWEAPRGLPASDLVCGVSFRFCTGRAVRVSKGYRPRGQREFTNCAVFVSLDGHSSEKHVGGGDHALRLLGASVRKTTILTKRLVTKCLEATNRHVHLLITSVHKATVLPKISVTHSHVDQQMQKGLNAAQSGT